MRILDRMKMMEAKLVEYSTQVGWTETYRVDVSLREVTEMARWLEVMHEKSGDGCCASFNRSKERVLFYLIYFERLRKHMAGDARPLALERFDLFAYADHNDWVKAHRAAHRQMGEYLHSHYVKEKS